MNTDWAAIYERFDPEEPVPVDHPTWRVRRPYNPTDKLRPQLNLPFGEKRFLIIGTVGTGKSTELHQLAEARTERDFVVLVDLLSHFVERVRDSNALNSVQPWEVIFLVGLHLYRAAEQAGHVWPSSAAQALADAQASFAPAGAPRVDIAKLASTLTVWVGGLLDGGASLVVGALGKAVGSGQWSLTIGRQGPTADQDARVQHMLHVVNQMIVDLEARYTPRRVSIFIDGLDRVRALDTIRRLFVESSLLGRLKCTTVVTGPIAVRRESLAGQVRGFQTHVLGNVPVLDPLSVEILDPEQHPDPQAAIGLGLTPTGRAFFREAWSSRADDLAPAAIPEALLDRMAWASGGRAREFVRMVRMVAGASYSRGLDVATLNVVDEVIDDLRRLFELGINRHHIAVLRGVLADPRHELPDDPAVPEMLDKFWLLPYPNQSEWYYPNPLLLIHKLRGSPDSAMR